MFPEVSCLQIPRCQVLRKCSGDDKATPLQLVVISQTHWLVSQERLSPRAGTSVFIMYTVVPSGGSGSKFTAGVSHHTPPLGGTGLYR